MGIDEILEAVIAPHAAAARQRPMAPLRAMIIDCVVRQLRRRRDAGARGRRRAQQGRAHPHDGQQRGLRRSSSSACSRRKSRARATSSKAGEVGFIIAGIKELQAAKVGDTITLEKKLPNNAGPADRGAARLQGDPAAGLRRPVPDRGQRIRPAARRAREAEAQRLARCATSPRSARRSASAFAAASSACCTWRSCRSGSSASSTRT